MLHDNVALRANPIAHLETFDLPAAAITQGTIIACNDAFVSLMNSSYEKLLGTAFESILARFAGDDGTLQAGPVSLRESTPPQTVYLKPQGQCPVCAAMVVEAAKGNDGQVLVATFSLLNAEVHARQGAEIFRGQASSRLWHVAVFDHDHLTDTVYMSPLFREIYGVETEEELAFQDVGRFIHPDDVDLEAVRSAHDPTSNGLFDKAFRIIRRSGEIRWIHSRSQTLFDVVDGQRRAVRTTGAIVDFTDEHRLKKALEETKQKLADILDSLPSIVLGVTRDGHIVQWNRQAEMQSCVAAVAPEDRTLGSMFPMLGYRMRWIEKAMSAGERLEVRRIPYSRHDSTFFYDVSIIPLRNDATDVVVRIDDVSEEVRVEQTLIQSEKLLSVGGLAAGMAHEVNNPLFVIIQCALTILERLDLDRNENLAAAARVGIPLDKVLAYLENQEILEMLDGIQEAGNRASTIIRSMLGFVRASDGRRRPCDIVDLIDKTTELLRYDQNLKTKHSFRDVKILKEYTTHLAEVPCDSGKIQQVFLNILKNASQAMSQAKTPSPEIRIRVCEVPGYLRIEIEDNGPGIPDEVSRRIFEPFFTTKPQGEGTGLGLSISYSIVVDEHQGNMYFQKGATGGSRFIVELPQSTATVSATLAS